MRTRIFCTVIVTIAASVLVAMLGCGGGGGSTAASTVLVPARASGRVILPPGFQGSLTGMVVASGIDQQPVAADGSFAVRAPGAGMSPVDLLNANGKLVLRGFVDAAPSGSPVAGGHGEISAAQTAIALLFDGAGIFQLPTDTWTSARGLIAQSVEAPQLASVVVARVAANPTALADSDTQLYAAVSQASAALIQTGRTVAAAGTAARSGGALSRNVPPASTAPTIATAGTIEVVGSPHGRDANITQLLVQPSGQQSGVEVLNNPKGSGILFVNHFRRRCVAFIYETAVQRQGESAVNKLSAPIAFPANQPTTVAALVPAFLKGQIPAAFPGLELSAANPLHGLIGSLTDLVQGLTAFKQAETGPMDLPQDGDAIKTVYTVIVVGASDLGKSGTSAAFQNPDFAGFTDIWQATIRSLGFEEVILDILIPILASTNLGDEVMVGNFSGEAIKEFINEMSSVPDFNQSTATGDFKGAAAAFIQVMVDNGGLREKIITLVVSQFVKADNIAGQVKAASAKLERAFAVTGAVDLILQAVDSAAVHAAFVQSAPAEVWTATVSNVTVRLSPATATVSAGTQTVTLTATPGVSGDPAAPFVYHWSVAGSAGGGLEDSAHLSGQDKDFDSADSKISYAEAASALDSQTATVTVEMFVNSGNLSHPARGQRVGQAQSVITVSNSGCGTGSPGTDITSGCGDMTIGSSTVAPGGHLIVNVNIHTGGACGNGATLSLNAVPVSSVTLDGVPQNSAVVGIPGGPHTVDYQVALEAQECSGTQVANSDANLIIPQIFGPWVLLQEGTGGNNSGWTTQHPITIKR